METITPVAQVEVLVLCPGKRNTQSLQGIISTRTKIINNTPKIRCPMIQYFLDKSMGYFLKITNEITLIVTKLHYQ